MWPICDILKTTKFEELLLTPLYTFKYSNIPSVYSYSKVVVLHFELQLYKNHTNKTRDLKLGEYHDFV